MSFWSSSTNPRLATQIAVLLLASLVCAVGSQFLLPNRIGWIASWANVVGDAAAGDGVVIADLATAREIANTQSHVIFDARKIADYEQGHLPGAFALPHDNIDLYFQPLLPLLVENQPVMTYCSSKDCDEALELTRYLRRNGFTNVLLFLGGFAEWDAAGYPVEGRKP